jgi:hypothetical protein
MAVEQSRETKGVEVGEGKRGGQSGTIRQAPWAEWTARRGCGESRGDTKMPQLRVPPFAAFPLLPDHGSQPTTYPLIQLLQQ